MACDFAFTLKDSGGLRPDPALTFAWESYTPESLRVSGLVWRSRQKQGSRSAPTTLNKASTQQVKKTLEGGGTFAMHYKVTCRGAVKPQTLQGRLLIVAPNGFSYAVDGPVVLCEESRRYDMLASGFFPALLAECGDLPAGDYRLILFLEGMPANVNVMTLQ